MTTTEMDTTQAVTSTFEETSDEVTTVKTTAGTTTAEDATTTDITTSAASTQTATDEGPSTGVATTTGIPTTTYQVTTASPLITTNVAVSGPTSVVLRSTGTPDHLTTDHVSTAGTKEPGISIVPIAAGAGAGGLVLIIIIIALVIQAKRGNLKCGKKKKEEQKETPVLRPDQYTHWNIEPNRDSTDDLDVRVETPQTFQPDEHTVGFDTDQRTTGGQTTGADEMLCRKSLKGQPVERETMYPDGMGPLYDNLPRGQVVPSAAVTEKPVAEPPRQSKRFSNLFRNAFQNFLKSKSGDVGSIQEVEEQPQGGGATMIGLQDISEQTGEAEGEQEVYQNAGQIQAMLHSPMQ